MPLGNLPRPQALAGTLEFNPSRPQRLHLRGNELSRRGTRIDPIMRTILTGAPRRGDATKRYADRDLVQCIDIIDAA
jgi:hypothetical protein